MKIDFVQLAYPIEDKKALIAFVEQRVTQSKADVVVFPELCGWGAGTVAQQLRDAAELVPGGQLCVFLSRLAWRSRRLIVFGLAELSTRGDPDEGDTREKGDAYYNTAIVVGARGIIGKIQKTQLSEPERKAFFTGDSASCVVPWKGQNLLVRFGQGIEVEVI